MIPYADAMPITQGFARFNKDPLLPYQRYIIAHTAGGNYRSRGSALLSSAVTQFSVEQRQAHPGVQL